MEAILAIYTYAGIKRFQNATQVYILQEFAGESKGRFPLIHLSTISTVPPVVQLLASLEH